MPDTPNIRITITLNARIRLQKGVVLPAAGAGLKFIFLPPGDYDAEVDETSAHIKFLSSGEDIIYSVSLAFVEILLPD